MQYYQLAFEESGMTTSDISYHIGSTASREQSGLLSQIADSV